MSNLTIGGKARGEFNLLVKRKDGTKERFKFNNLLLNNIFTQNTSDINYCTVGSGTTAPAVTDTQLVSRIGTNLSANGVKSAVATTWSGSIATVSIKSSFVFSTGSILGNVSELALYKTSAISSANIIIRSLVKDVDGNPTTITLGAGDQLTVEHFLYITIETRPDPVIINLKGIDYSASIVVAYPEIFSDGLSSSFGALYTPNISASSNGGRAVQTISVPAVGSIGYVAYGSVSAAFTTSATYNNSNSGSGYHEATVSFTMPTSTQLAGGVPIGGIAIGNTPSTLKVAILFDPPLPKDSSVGYTFSLTSKLSRV